MKNISNSSIQRMRYMPVGIQDFPCIIKEGYVYVDKTHFIPRLEVVGRTHFLSRPRRFGKSLFLSMLESYFLGEKELFKGLAIERFKEERGDKWNAYPVLKLDLNCGEYTKENSLVDVLNEHIKNWSEQFEIDIDTPSTTLAFYQIIRLISAKFKRNVVILIDEYDKPLLDSLNNHKINAEYRSTLKAFYSVIKSLNGCIHLSFLTGVTKFSKVSIFSDLNNLFDISFDDEYSSICGITEEELIRNFSPEIKAMANKEDKRFDEMRNILRRKYDGYRFGRKDERIYNPFSIVTALAKKELDNYWFETGTPSFLVQLFEDKYLDIPDLENGIVADKRELDIYRMNDGNLIPLLFQSGYITIKDYKKDSLSFNGRFVLGYPNDEVRYTFLFCLMQVYTSAKKSYAGGFKIELFREALETGDIERVLTLIKALMASIPYDSLPKDKFFLREYNYQMTIYLIFALMGEYVRTEVHSSLGRSDVEVETVDSIYLFEFKVGGKPSDAIAQIKQMGYAEKHLVSNKNIFLIGATISRNKRSLGKWQVEKMK